MKLVVKFKDSPRKKTLHVWKNTHVHQICGLVEHDTDEKLFLEYKGERLLARRTLKSAKLRSGSVVFLVREYRRVLSTSTETSKEPCMITLENNSRRPRAQMSCGHAITPGGLFQFLNVELAAGKTQICCPYTRMDNTFQQCNKVWDFNEVQEKACLTRFENSEMMRKLRINIMNFEKMQDNNNMNSDAYILKLLLQCENKTLYGRRGKETCPSRRACPRCGVFIDHIAGCPSMTCGVKACGHVFCFICLKDSCNSSNCFVAPIQFRNRESNFKKKRPMKKIGILKK
ncbi:hypothetical protein ScPMuIL_003664 [Solemya velum]